MKYDLKEVNALVEQLKVNDINGTYSPLIAFVLDEVKKQEKARNKKVNEAPVEKGE